MLETFLGVDIGSISTKGVLIDSSGQIVWSNYIWTNGNPILSVKKLISGLDDKFNILSAGTTGSARKLIGTMLNADVVKNEITAHAIGTLKIFPNASTIFEIGGQDSKIIIIEDGIVVDYAMNTLCAAGTGSFLSSQSNRLGIDINELGDIALKSKNPAKIAARCTVFAESDLVHKTQTGYKKEDIAMGLCNAVVGNYLNNLTKGKRIKSPIIFQGGVSRNVGVVRAFENALGERVFVDKNGHLAGAIGMAILSQKSQSRNFNYSLIDEDFETLANECNKCGNNCELISVKRAGKLIDIWGSRCGNISPKNIV